MKKRFLILFLLCGLDYFPRLHAAMPLNGFTETTVRTSRLSERKMQKIQRFWKKIIRHGNASDLPDRLLWTGLFGLGLALCLALFSVSLGGIVAAAALACLIIGGIFKLGTM
ncbi:MAG TPA: hypothetical protein PLO67_03780 [Saprospiraceae bacterium]|nr:hypothetical protein [Saprospiraceae bacterium]HPI07346.1 hypothetical protein [Saprospiraceae bacterium]